MSAPFFVFVASVSASTVLRMYSEPPKRSTSSWSRRATSSSVSSAGVRLRVVGHRAQQDGDRQLALAVDADEDLALLVDLQLEPRAAGRHQVRDEDLLLAVLGLHQVGARGADELRDDDALGAVDDERAALGHPREVAHEDRLLADLARLVVDEGDGDRQRARVGQVLLAALLDRRGRLVEVELAEVDGEVPGVVLDRRDVVDRLPQAPLLGVDQPLERAALDVDEVGDIDGLVQAREGTALAGGVNTRHDGRLLEGSKGRARGASAPKTNHGEARPAKIAQRGGPPFGGGRPHGPRPGPPRMWRGAQKWAATTIGRRAQCSGARRRAPAAPAPAGRARPPRGRAAMI